MSVWLAGGFKCEARREVLHSDGFILSSEREE